MCVGRECLKPRLNDVLVGSCGARTCTCTQTIIVCIPLVVILDNVSTDGRHIGFCFILLFAGPVEVIAFIFLPKILTFYKIIDQNPIRVRGARPQGGVHISGVAHPSSQVTSTARGSTKAEQGSKPFST